MVPVHVAVWLALLLNADSASTTPAPSPSMRSLMGRLFTVEHGDTMPAANVTVLLLGTRIGALSDETGAYALTGLSPGQNQILIKSPSTITRVDVVSVSAGQTLRRDYRLDREGYAIVSDSLKTLGLWPPALDPDLLANMHGAHDVRVFRLGEPLGHPTVVPNSGKWIGRWPIIGEGRRPKHHVVAEVIDALRGSSYWIPGMVGPTTTKVPYGRPTGIDVRFTGKGVPVDVLLWYDRDQVSIWREGRWAQSGDFGDDRLVTFARQAFPHDAYLGAVLARHAPSPHRLPDHQ